MSGSQNSGVNTSNPSSLASARSAVGKVVVFVALGGAGVFVYGLLSKKTPEFQTKPGPETPSQSPTIDRIQLAGVVALALVLGGVELLARGPENIAFGSTWPIFGTLGLAVAAVVQTWLAITELPPVPKGETVEERTKRRRQDWTGVGWASLLYGSVLLLVDSLYP